MKVPELKALAKEGGLKRYSKLRKAELIALLTAPRTRPPLPPPSKPDRTRQLELLEERQSLTTTQIKRRRNKANKLNK